MRKKQYKPSNHRGLQVITLCISTAMVLILLGLVIFSVLMGRNLSSYVKENLVVQVMLEQDMTNPEGLQICKRLKARPYVNTLTYITKEEALKEATRDLGTNPSERSEEHTSELQSRFDLVCRLLLEKKKKNSTLIA